MHQKTEDITASSETKVAKAVLNPGSEEGLEVMTKAPVGNSGGQVPSPGLSRRSPKDEAGKGRQKTQLSTPST